MAVLDLTYNLSLLGRRKSRSDGTDSCEENLSKKDLALHQALDQITASFGKGAIMWLGRSHGPREVPVVSTGSFALDMALGIGGLPKVCAYCWSSNTVCMLHLADGKMRFSSVCVCV